MASDILFLINGDYLQVSCRLLLRIRKKEKVKILELANHLLLETETISKVKPASLGYPLEL